MRNGNGRRARLLLSQARSWLAGVGWPDAFWALVAFATAMLAAVGAFSVPILIVVALVLMTIGAWSRRRSWPRRAAAWRLGLGTLLFARLILLTTLLSWSIAEAQSPWAVAAVGVICVTTLLEHFVRRAGERATRIEYNFEVTNEPAWATAVSSIWLATVNFAAFAIVAGGQSWPPLAFAAALIAGAWLIWSLAAVARRIVARFAAERRVGDAIDQLNPEFVLYWSAAANTDYQVGMWLPMLERLGRPFIVVTRRPVNAREAAALTSAPVLYCRDPADLDRVVVPSLRVAFYVNNAAANTQFVRYPQLRHVMLNHGESDKAPSYNPVSRMYDYNFVAGRAGIDRFRSHGVTVYDEQFRIVGRPQLSKVHVGAREGDGRTVLFAPTWRGHTEDAMNPALDVGVAIVQHLIAAGCTVVFRPHPYAYRDVFHRSVIEDVQALLRADAEAAGRAHVYGPDAETVTIEDCINAGDVLVSDTSSVIADFLYSERPIILVTARRTIDEFVADNPVAAGAYLADGSLAGLDAMIADAIGPDSLRSKRLDIKNYYIGGGERGGSGELFVETALEVLETAAE